MEASLRLFNGLGVQFGTIMSKVVLIIPRKSGGGALPETLGGLCGLLPETIFATLFMT